MRGLREQPARVLATRPLEEAGGSSSGRGPVLLRGPRGQMQIPAQPLLLANLAQTFLASSDTATRRGRLPGVCAVMPVPLTGSAPLGRFPWA